MEDKKYYIVYKITNKLNDNIYIGCHVTENINDKYMGSGSNIKKAIKEFGVENFEKIILYNFDNMKDMLNKERELVNEEFITRKDTYNIILGGVFNSLGTVTVKDKDNNYYKVHKTDSRYLSGELVHITTGLIPVRDKNNNILSVSVNDERYLNGELITTMTGFVTVKDKNNKTLCVSVNDERYLNGELVPIATGFVTVKDNNNKTLRISVNDEKYLNGELIPIWLGKKHKKETKNKMSKSHIGKHEGIKNTQYGTCWIYNEKLKESKKIKKEEINDWINKDWKKGRKMNF